MKQKPTNPPTQSVKQVRLGLGLRREWPIFKLDFETINGETIIPRLLKHVSQYPYFYAKSAGLRNEAIYRTKDRINIEFGKMSSPGKSIAK